MTMLAEEKLEDIIDKNDKDLMDMVNYIKENKSGFINNGKFKTFTLETSRGKTIGSAYAMSQSVLKGNDTKYIFTTKKLDECKRVANIIKKELKDITFQDKNETIVMVYTPSEKEDTLISSSDFYKCARSKILIVTHSTYLNLCKPKTKFHEGYAENVRKYFDTLIIDEEINAVLDNLCTFNQYIYEDTLRLIKCTNNKEILAFYEWLCNILKETINEYEKHNCYKNKILIAEKDDINIFPHMAYEELIESIKIIDNEVIEDFSYETERVTKSDIILRIQKLYTIYQNINFDKVLYWNESLYSCDFDFEFLMLKKNIMLDASANFNTLYDSNIFDTVKSKRVIDHTKCYLLWHNINTSKSAKRGKSDKDQLTNFRKYIINDIKKKAKKDSEVLIITNKSECDALDKRFIDDEFKKNFENYAFLNFFNMRGVDNFAEYKECFIIHTPRFPFPIYILMYMYYIMKEDIDIFKLDMSYGKFRGNNSIGFKDKILDGLLFSDEISALYQACKRTCRNREPQGNFHVYNSNFDVIKAIQNELLNVKIIPDEDNKRAKLCEDFYFMLIKIRELKYSEFSPLNVLTLKLNCSNSSTICPDNC